MKRDSPPHEATTEDASPDKKPKLDDSGSAKPENTGTSALTPVSGALTGSSASTPAISDTTPAEPSTSTSKDPDDSTPSSSKHKNNFRGGRGKRRDQRAKTSRNAERKGGWESRGTRNGEEKPADDGEKTPRLPKKKVAVLIGFCGTGYNGMQIQRDEGTNTIENTLFDAMVKAGAVSKDNSDDPVKVILQRAARTDAGVHAAGNVVSLKMITEPPDTPDLVAKLNELLPPEIRVWTFVRATNAFNSRACDSRVYEYMFPSSALLPPMPGTPMEKHTKPEPLDPNGPDWEYWTRPDATKSETMRAWRIGRGQFETLRESAKLYEGTHNFHNFTIGLEHTDPSAQRYMISIDVKEPYVLDGIEWISIMYHGQSFMLHQIRKMTTLLIFTSRTGTPAASLIPQTFNSNRLLIPKAPALGLLLQEPRFGTYNKHVLEENELANGRGQTDRIRELIEWEALREKTDAFKHAYIYSRIRAEEAKHGVFAAWLKFIDDYEGWEFKYLNPRGEVVPESVMHRDKRKRGSANKFREYLWKNPASKTGEDATDSEDGDGGGKKPDVEMEG